MKPRSPEPRETDSQKFIKAEEQKLIEYTRQQAEKKKKDEEKRKKDALPVFELNPPRQLAADLMLSPDGQHVFIIVNDRAEGAKQTIVPNYVTESAYTEDIPGRTKVGDAQDRRRLAILNVQTGNIAWADGSFAGRQKATPPAGEDKAAAGPKEPKEADRGIRWAMPQVSTDGQYAIAWVRSTDNKDRWIVAVDPETGKCRVLDALHDDAWVNDFGGTGWLPDDRTIYFTSEADGWMHLYSLDVSQAGAKATQLTSGRFEVTRVALSPDKKRFYLVTSEKHPGERHIYSMALNGGARTAIDSMTGSNVGEVSPDDSTFGIVYSYSNRPPELYLMPNTPGAPARQVTTTPTDEWRSFKWADPQVLTFKARDGVEVYARLFTPEMLGAPRDPLAAGRGLRARRRLRAERAQVLVELLPRVHVPQPAGVARLRRARRRLPRELRATAATGARRSTGTWAARTWTTSSTARSTWSRQQRVNPKRIGIYGGSYGGFITLMAMFTPPDIFAAGAALRPVTDWAHYNHGYTADILNVPQNDAEAYRQQLADLFRRGA